MKKGTSPIGGEYFSFGTDNKLRIFPPNTFKFKPRDHIVLDEIQECILDNCWFQYNNKREDRGYMLAILNSLAEYFHMINGKMQPKESSGNIEKKPIYVIYRGKIPGIYITFESIIAQQVERENDGGVSWKKYSDIDQALSYARSILGVNYFIEPAAKDYIQKYKRVKDVKINLPGVNIREDGSSKIPTYKDVVKRETQWLNDEIIEKKLKEKLEAIIPQLKKNIMEEVLQEVRHDINGKFESIHQDYEENIKRDYEEYIKKDYESKINMQISDDNNDDMLDDNMLDIHGHGQQPEY
jgi:hypothetical protein